MSNIMRKIVILHRQKQRSEILSYTVPSLASMALLHPYPFFCGFSAKLCWTFTGSLKEDDFSCKAAQIVKRQP